MAVYELQFICTFFEWRILGFTSNLDIPSHLYVYLLFQQQQFLIFSLDIHLNNLFLPIY